MTRSTPNVDVAIVGAGLVGLTTAVLLARAGARVEVIDARTPGAGTSGLTTGKFSVLQGTRLSAIARMHGREVAYQYVLANQEGLAWARTYCHDRFVPWQQRDAVTFAQYPAGVGLLDREAQACVDAGLAVRRDELMGARFEHAGGLVLPGQGQVDPLDLMRALVADLGERGVPVRTGARAVVRRSGAGVRVAWLGGGVLADRVVLATGVPPGVRGAFFARLDPARSYINAYDITGVGGAISEQMCISADAPTRSVRVLHRASAPGGRLLLVGGEGHTTGRGRATSEHVTALDEWARYSYPGVRRVASWSAQDYHPLAHLPSVGAARPGDGRIYVATGFAKWGMTNGVAAALALAGMLLGGRMDWAHVYDPWALRRVRAIPAAVRMNAATVGEAMRGWVGAARAPRERAHVVTGDGPAASDTGEAPSAHAGASEADGQVLRRGMRPVARSTVDAVTCTVSAVCPHAGGIVRWNSAAATWDCPLHGSRFAPDGTALEGPTKRGLRPR